MFLCINLYSFHSLISLTSLILSFTKNDLSFSLSLSLSQSLSLSLSLSIYIYIYIYIYAYGKDILFLCINLYSFHSLISLTSLILSFTKNDLSFPLSLSLSVSLSLSIYIYTYAYGKDILFLCINLYSFHSLISLTSLILSFTKNDLSFPLSFSLSQSLSLSLSINLTIYHYLCKSTIVESDRKTPFSIATTPRGREGRHSVPWIAPLYPWYVPYNTEC